MKHSFKFAAIMAALCAVLFVGCDNNPDPNPDQETLEAFIKSIKIVNGGISGGDLITGEVDQTLKVITFNNVAAETNIAAVKFQGTYSLGAYLESDVIDFTANNDASSKSLNGSLKCINKGETGSVEETYEVVLNLSDPASAPVIEKIVVKDNNGTENTLTSANILDGMLCLGFPEASTITIVSVELSPARSTYEFTTAKDGVIYASEPGFFKMDFMGLTAEYEVTFSSSPTPGADWSQAIRHDFSITSGNVYPDFAEEFTRGGDFDGQYVLLVNRTAPKLFRVADLLNEDTSAPIMLDITGIDGGTFAISAGRFSHGHIYICNLCAVGADWSETGGFKIYHYASPTATPEKIFDWNGTGVVNSENDYNGRLGDNLSVNLDENGNGYIFCFKQEADQKFYRFTVSNFTSISEPTELELPAIANYYGMMNQVGENIYIMKATFNANMWLLDKDATVLREFEWDTMGEEGISVSHATDPHVIEFNRSRYLLLSNARRYLYWAEEGVHVFDISDGNDIVSAMVKMQEAQDAETLMPVFSYEMPGETVSLACVALCNAAEVDGKLVIWAAAPHIGMCLIEVPKMK